MFSPVLPSSPSLRFSGTTLLSDALDERKGPVWKEAADAYIRTLSGNGRSLALYRQEISAASFDHANSLINEFGDLVNALDEIREAGFANRAFELRRLARNVPDIIRNDRTAAKEDRILGILQPVRLEMRELQAEIEAAPLSQTVKGLARDVLESVNALYKKQASLKALSDLNLMVADNIVRDRVYYSSPIALPKQMERKWGSEVADLLVIGAGPAGLSTGLHAAESGLKTLVVDGGYAIQSFSDQFMQAVHVMRTNAERSSLTNPGTSPAGMHDAHGMPARLPEYRVKGSLARRAVRALTGRELIGNPPEPTRASQAFRELIVRDELPERILDRLREDPGVPVARNELFQYFDKIIDTLAEHDNGLVLEQSPVVSVTRLKNGEFEVQTGKGHVIRARNIALATGAVGSDGQYVRDNFLFQDMARRNQGRFVTMWDRNALVGKNAQLISIMTDLKAGRRPIQQLMFSDPVLGSRQVSDIVTALPRNSQSMVVGGGESGAKGVVELFNLNPDIVVHWFVERMPRGDQLQVPATNASAELMEKCMDDPAMALETIREWKEEFGVPITPQTLGDLRRLEAQGRLKIHELGAKFDAATMELVPTHRGVEIYDKRQPGGGLRQRFLTGNNKLATVDGVIISAIGYDRDALREEDPLSRKLENSGLIKFDPHGSRLTENEICLSDNGLCSSLDGNVYTVGACNYGMAADSAIFGMPVRAANIVEDIQRKQTFRYKLAKLLGFAR